MSDAAPNDQKIRPEATSAVDLLYPFYLDDDMSMAFAAALSGGVALEEEHVDRLSDASQAVKNLRGNLNLWRVGGVGGGRERSEASEAAVESRLIRRHTEASIFIALYDELRRTEQLSLDPAFDEIEEGDIVAIKMGPAVAPLRRVVEQVIRLLDLIAPTLGVETGDASGEQASTQRGAKRQHRQSGKPVVEKSPEVREYEGLRRLFEALKSDLEHSGMIDIVVDRGDLPTAILTLDERFVSAPTLELLHTSRFTVVGKVSATWQTGEFVNLYRRSVLSLVPALAQATAWGLFGMLGSMGKAIDVQAMQQGANEALGIRGGAPPTSAGESHEGSDAASEATDGPADGEQEAASDHRGQPVPGQEAEAEAGEVLISTEAAAALMPGVTGPAFQILPLAICS
jgi:hypothetical protein